MGTTTKQGARAASVGDWIAATSRTAPWILSLFFLTAHAGDGPSAPLRPRLKTFSFGDYEAVAIKDNGDVEVRTFVPHNMAPTTFAPPRRLEGLRDAVWVKSQIAFQTPVIGIVSGARSRAGKWRAWAPNGSESDLPFAQSLDAMQMSAAGAPDDSHIVDVEAGSYGLTWRLYDDGTVLMSAARGIFPMEGLLRWQKLHKLDGIVKVCAFPGPQGSIHALMLRSDGTVWANNDRFVMGWVLQPGPGRGGKPPTKADPDYSAIRIPELVHVKDIAVYWPLTGVGKGVAVLIDGSVQYIQIDPREHAAANGLTQEHSTKFVVTSKKVPGKAVRAAAGKYGVGVIDEGGRVWVWGSNPDSWDDQGHSVGSYRGKPVEFSQLEEPIMVDGIADAVDLDFSPQFAGAVLKNGQVWAWTSFPPQKVFDNVRLPTDGADMVAQSDPGDLRRLEPTVPSDPALAEDWYRKAADLGDFDAQKKLGLGTRTTGETPEQAALRLRQTLTETFTSVLQMSLSEQQTQPQTQQPPQRLNYWNGEERRKEPR